MCLSTCTCALSTLACRPASIGQINARLPPVSLLLFARTKQLAPRRGGKVGWPFVIVSSSRKERRVDGGGRGDESSRRASLSLWPSAPAPLRAKYNHFCRDTMFTAHSRLGIRYENSLSAPVCARVCLWVFRSGVFPPHPFRKPSVFVALTRVN